MAFTLAEGAGLGVPAGNSTVNGHSSVSSTLASSTNSCYIVAVTIDDNHLLMIRKNCTHADRLTGQRSSAPLLCTGF